MRKNGRALRSGRGGGSRLRGGVVVLAVLDVAAALAFVLLEFADVLVALLFISAEFLGFLVAVGSGVVEVLAVVDEIFAIFLQIGTGLFGTVLVALADFLTQILLVLVDVGAFLADVTTVFANILLVGTKFFFVLMDFFLVADDFATVATDFLGVATDFSGLSDGDGECSESEEGEEGFEFHVA